MPTIPDYPWQRRWLPVVPAADPLAVPYDLDQTGYVSLRQWSRKSEPKWRGQLLEELTVQQRCVVLLGEPGMGKSWEWHAQQTRLADQPGHLFLNLGGIDSEETLRREVLDSAAVAAWRGTQAPLTLWLDSLDEGLLHVQVLQPALLRMLRALLPLGHLCLRILCRSAVWPAGFTEALTRQLGLPDPGSAGPDEAPLLLLLSPLSREQVAQAAEAEGFAAEQFLAAVAAADAQPLASRPVTLALLLKLYRRHQPTFGLPDEAGRAGLYELGCLALCERPDQDRPEAHRQDPHQRLLLAGYVALLGVLTNRRVVAAEPLPGAAGPNELDVYALGGGSTVAWRATTASLTVPALRDLFRNTALFTDAGQGRLVWAHQSYAEFLAAWYLQLAALPAASLRPLFRSAVDPAGGIVPALRETAAWLADMQAAFWDELLVLDPAALLPSDLRRLPVARRAQLVTRLLEWVAGRAYPPYQGTSFLTHLAHPGLAALLEPHLEDPHPPGAVGQFITDVIREANVVELRPLLLRQALDPAGAWALRSRALHLLSGMADEATLTALRPLLWQAGSEEESTIRLRERLLPLLWPSHLQLEEVLPLLAGRRARALGGLAHYLLPDLEQGRWPLSRASLLATLRWLTQHSAQWRDEEEQFWPALARYVQRQAWAQVADAEVAAALAEAIIAATEDYHPFSADGTPAQRLAMLARLLPRHRRLANNSLADTSFGPGQEPALIRAEDWPAVYALLATPLSRSARAWLADLLSQLLHMLRRAEHPDYLVRFGELYRAGRRYPSVRTVLARSVAASDLTDVRQQRRIEVWHLQRQRQRVEANKRRCWRSLTLHRLARSWRDIRRVLAHPGPGTLHDWQVLSQRLTTTQVKRGFSQVHDVAAAPRWACLPTARQQQVTELAHRVLLAYPKLPAEWVTAGSWPTTGAVLLHQVLLLLQHQQPAWLDARPVAFWTSWSELLVRYRPYEHDHPSQAALLRRAWEVAPTRVAEALYQLADVHGGREDARLPGFAASYRALPEDAFAPRLLAAIEAGTWTDGASGRLLADMLQVGYAPAWAYAAQLLPEPGAGPKVPCARPGLVAAVYQWLLFDRERQRTSLWLWWQRLQSQPALARQVLNAAVSHASARELQHLALLEEEQLATLVRWLSADFALAPEEADGWRDHPDGGLVAVRAAAATELAARGTASARDLLQQLTAALGRPFWLLARLDQVRENLRRNAWEPLPPDALATLTREASRRWVRSAADLQELLLESLARFQADLHGEPTTAQVLWFPVKNPQNRRKLLRYEVHEENYFSNVLRQHLRQDLQRANLLIKREVEIRPAMGSGSGQRTDIFVEAFIRSPAGERLEVVQVVIEVKLSRHPDVLMALETQLAAYLTDQSYRHGIYLVGWHFGQHDPQPPRLPALPQLTAQLTRQAAALAPAHVIRACVLDIRLPADSARQQAE